jgi:hypothetical protein
MLRNIIKVNVPAVRAFSTVCVTREYDFDTAVPPKVADWATMRKEQGKSFIFDQDAKKKADDKRQAPIRMGEEKKWRDGLLNNRTSMNREEWN